MGQAQPWCVRSFSSQALVWLQSRYRRARMRGFQAIWIVGPFLRKIQRAVDERMTVARNVGREDADLAVRDLARRTSVLTRHAARGFALFEKAGLIDHEDSVIVLLDDIIADDIAQGIRIAISATQYFLLPPWARIACGL